MRRHGSRAGVVAAASLALALPAVALGHVERPGYWPDPAPDTSVTPATGGKVPKARSLASALKKKPPGQTRVVCHKNSMVYVRRSIKKARADGFFDRPSVRRTLSKKAARRLLRVNRQLKKRCRFRQIQPAVTASRNNDRVVVMPGVYMEQTSRKAPTNDPACNEYKTNGDKPGTEGEALSYAYQVNCPNDQNLIAVMGRAVSPEPDLVPPRENRHGIPNPGPCIRCNFQLEGSGVKANDVIIEAGDLAAGNGGPSGVGAKKDVAIRADRADGFVLRNVTTRHAGEHGIYVLESDGYLLDRFKTYYNRLYGTLTFVPDHGVQQNCEAVGHGDSGLYPGAATETGAQRPAGTDFRYNQQVRRCDMHHNLAGWSGTNGNAVHTHHNNIYDNALGIQTDVVTGAGHPGYPGDSALFEHNQIYSNNFDPYADDSDVKPAFPFPVGTGLWIAGGNSHIVRENHFYDNWRRGTMVFSVPDSLVCGEAAGGNQQAGCNPNEVSTSHYNSHYDNKMGVTPAGQADPNGTDFWWDQFAGSRGNCWYRNTGPKPITTSPGPLPECNDGKDPATSIGTGSPNEAELVRCFATFESRNFERPSPCPWLEPPTEPQPESGGGGGGPLPLPLARSAFTPPAAVSRSSGARATRRDPVPLGQMTCTDWNRAGDVGRFAMARALRKFAGGVVVTGERAVGTGAVLDEEGTRGLFEHWCGQTKARDFLLYKLYTHGAAFARRR